MKKKAFINSDSGKYIFDDGVAHNEFPNWKEMYEFVSKRNVHERFHWFLTVLRGKSRLMMYFKETEQDVLKQILDIEKRRPVFQVTELWLERERNFGRKRKNNNTQLGN